MELTLRASQGKTRAERTARRSDGHGAATLPLRRYADDLQLGGYGD